MKTQLDHYTDLLYDHKFDVDDIIFALCGDTHQGRWLLHTRKGDLIQEDPASPLDVQNGDDNNHWHEILPLPKSFLDEMFQSPNYTRLTEAEKTELKTLMADVKHLADLPPLFETGFAGGWLRERVKDASLKWMDARGLIPPSMTHVYRKHATSQTKGSTSGATKVILESLDN